MKFNISRKYIYIVVGVFLLLLILMTQKLYKTSTVSTHAQNTPCTLEATYNVKDEFGNILTKKDLFAPEVWQIYNNKQGPLDSFGFNGDKLTRTIRLSVQDGSLRFRCNNNDVKCNPEAPFAEGELASIFLDTDPKFEIVDRRINKCQYSGNFPSYYCPTLGSMTAGAKNEIAGIPIQCNMKYELDWIVKSACKSVASVIISDEDGNLFQRNDLGDLTSWGISNNKENQNSPEFTFDKTQDTGNSLFEIKNENLSFKPANPQAKYFDNEVGKIKLFHRPDFEVVDRSMPICRSMLSPNVKMCPWTNPLPGDKDEIPEVLMKCNMQYQFNFKVKQSPPAGSCGLEGRVCVREAPRNWESRCTGVDPNKTIHWCCAPGQIILGETCQTPCPMGEYRNKSDKCVSITNHKCSIVKQGTNGHTLLFVAQRGTTLEDLDKLITDSQNRIKEVSGEGKPDFGKTLNKMTIMKYELDEADFGCHTRKIAELGVYSHSVECNHLELIETLKNYCNAQTIIFNTPFDTARSTATFSDLGIVTLSKNAYQALPHELGHAIASLYDEYERGADSGDDDSKFAPNCTDDSECKKWNCQNKSDCCIASCKYKNWFRPSVDSIMKNGYTSNIFNKPSVDAFLDFFSGTITKRKKNTQFDKKTSLAIRFDVEDQNAKLDTIVESKLPPSQPKTALPGSNPIVITLQNVAGNTIYKTELATSYYLLDAGQDSEPIKLNSVTSLIPYQSGNSLLTATYRGRTILQKRLFDLKPADSSIQPLIL